MTAALDRMTMTAELRRQPFFKKKAAVALRSATRVASLNRIPPHLSMTGSILPWGVLAEVFVPLHLPHMQGFPFYMLRVSRRIKNHIQVYVLHGDTLSKSDHLDLSAVDPPLPAYLTILPNVESVLPGCLSVTELLRYPFTKSPMMHQDHWWIFLTMKTRGSMVSVMKFLLAVRQS